MIVLMPIHMLRHLLLFEFLVIFFVVRFVWCNISFSLVLKSRNSFVCSVSDILLQLLRRLLQYEDPLKSPILISLFLSQC